jgi:hypothetical protein
MDAIGYGTWGEFTEFKFKCKTTRFANDKVRVTYMLPMEPNSAKAIFWNTDPASALIGGGKISLKEEEKYRVMLKQSNSFRQ